MKNKNKLYAFILSVILVFAMVTSVFAEGSGDVPPDPEPPVTNEGTETPANGITVKKRLEVAEGITLPDMTFSFTATPVTGTVDAPTVTIDDISYTDNDVENAVDPTDRKYQLEKSVNITIGELTTQGIFQYKVTETQNTYTGEGTVTYSTRVYDLFVAVAKGPDGLYIKSITAKLNDDKTDSITFINTFKKNASLTIKKEVVGDFASTTKEFNFEITFSRAGTTEATEGQTIIGMKGNEQITCVYGTPKSFTLHHGETLVFNNLPAGTRYSVVEKSGDVIDHYTASVVVTEDGITHAIKDATADDVDLTTEAQGQSTCLVGENTNTVVFINTHTEVAPTGILMNNLPFLLLVAIGICALGVLAVSKKRRTSKRQ